VEGVHHRDRVRDGLGASFRFRYVQPVPGCLASHTPITRARARGGWEA
jgi:hypothetical protein